MTIRPSDEIRHDINVAQDRAKWIDARIKAIEEEMATLGKERRNITGGYNQYGKIGRLRIELAESELHERDKTAAPVVWKKQPFSGSNQIVSRVTKKRIYVRSKGSSPETMYRKDSGLPVSDYGGYGQIDVDATLAQTVA